MNIKYFVKRINEVFPTYDQVKSKYIGIIPDFDLDKMEIYIENNKLRVVNDISPDLTFLENLIYNTNIATAGVGWINFSSDISLVENVYEEFATFNDFYRFCGEINGDNKPVSVFDQTFEQREIIAVSMDSFFTFLIYYDRYFKYVIYGTEYNIEESNEALRDLLKGGFSATWLRELMPDFDSDTKLN